jgi:hypothetical protein
VRQAARAVRHANRASTRRRSRRASFETPCQTGCRIRGHLPVRSRGASQGRSGHSVRRSTAPPRGGASARAAGGLDFMVAPSGASTSSTRSPCRRQPSSPAIVMRPTPRPTRFQATDSDCCRVESGAQRTGQD